MLCIFCVSTEGKLIVVGFLFTSGNLKVNRMWVPRHDFDWILDNLLHNTKHHIHTRLKPWVTNKFHLICLMDSQHANGEQQLVECSFSCSYTQKSVFFARSFAYSVSVTSTVDPHLSGPQLSGILGYPASISAHSI